MGAGCVDADPMICESQRRLRRHAWHMAVDAVAFGSIGRMGASMASGANGIVIAHVAAKSLMRIVARKAGERPIAVAKAGALAEVQRLMADVPREVPVNVYVLRGGRAVAFSAELIQLGAPHTSWVADVPRLGGMGVHLAWSVTRFAMNSRFRRGYAVARRVQRAGRVAAKAAVDALSRIYGAINQPDSFREGLGSGVLLTRSRRQSADRRVKTEMVLDVPIAIDTADEGHCLIAGSESPVEGNPHNIGRIEDTDLRTPVRDSKAVCEAR